MKIRATKMFRLISTSALLFLASLHFVFSQEIETIKIGDQIWMAKNLDISIDSSYCYGNEASNCNTYGRLYNWETAMHICPEGFRLPSDEDWTILTEFLGGKQTAGVKLLSKGESGFEAILGGNFTQSLNIFSYIEEHAYYWTSTSYSATAAWMRQLGKGQANINRSTVKKSFYFSVRCIKE